MEVKRKREGGAGKGMRVPSESVPFWFAVPEGEDSVWSNILLPHGDVLQGASEGEVPAGGLHGGAEWQLQVRRPVQFRERHSGALCKGLAAEELNFHLIHARESLP